MEFKKKLKYKAGNPQGPRSLRHEMSRSNTAIVGWNPVRGTPSALLSCVGSEAPCDGVISRTRSPTDCKIQISELIPKRAEARKPDL
jgi:hypothetical protein